MSEYHFQPENVAYIDWGDAVQRVQEEIEKKPQGVMQLVRESSATVAGRALISQAEAQLLSEIINPRDRSTGETTYDARAAYQATAGGVLLGWELCRKDFRKHELAPYGILERAMQQHVRPSEDKAEAVALTAESLVNTSGMGLALLSEQRETIDEWVGALVPDVRLQSLTKIGLGLMLHQAKRAVYQADLKKMEREAGRTNWESLAREIDSWRKGLGT